MYTAFKQETILKNVMEAYKEAQLHEASRCPTGDALPNMTEGAACANAVLLEEASVDRPGWWCLEEWPDGSLSDMPKSPERGVPCMPGPVCSSKLAWRASCSVGQSSSSSGGGTALCFSERGAGGRGVRWGCWGVSCVSPGDWDWEGGWGKSCVTPGGGGGGGWRPKVAQKVGSWGLRMGGCGTLGLGGRLCTPWDRR